MLKKPQKRKLDARLLHSAATPEDFLPPRGEEYAVLGRSNVGKSSFINHVLEFRLAPVSRTPGKTSRADFYIVDETVVWVDLPGYGYARVSGVERRRWSRLIRSYCEERQNLRGVLWLVDIRHPGTGMDIEARRWLEKLGLPFFTLLTKADKVKRRQATVLSQRAVEALRLPEEPLIYSVRSDQCRERFWLEFDLWRRRLSGEKR